MAVKLLLNTGLDLSDVDAAAEAALSLSNPLLHNLAKESTLMAALRHPNIVGFLVRPGGAPNWVGRRPHTALSGWRRRPSQQAGGPRCPARGAPLVLAVGQ